jgi:cytochrome c-type biogenesis protein CcmF
MGDAVGNGAWSLRLQVRPLMRLVWLGALLMALGGLLATFDRRYRRARAPATEAAGTAPALADGKAT